MQSLFELTENIKEDQKENNTNQMSADADLYEAILDLSEKLTNTMSALADLYELLLEQNGGE